MIVEEFFFRKAGKVFNVTKNRLCLVFPLGIYKVLFININIIVHTKVAWDFNIILISHHYTDYTVAL